MNPFTWVALGVIGYFFYSRASSGQPLFQLTTNSAAAFQAQQQAQLRALATAVNSKQNATAQQIAALNNAMQQLSKQAQQGSSKGTGAPSGGAGAPIGTQPAKGSAKGTQVVDALSQLFLASDLNGQQASAAQNVLTSGGTIEEAAAAAGVSSDQIIAAISPEIENIIQATAPSPVVSDLGTENLVQIDPTPFDVGVSGDQSDANFSNTGAAGPNSSWDSGLVQIDPIPLIDSGLSDTAMVGQDPATDPSFYQDNSLVGSNFTPSTVDMSSNQNATPYDPSTEMYANFDDSSGYDPYSTVDNWNNSPGVDDWG